MKTTDWIDANAACALLGVRPQTLYAYVSRKRVRAEADAGDARRSLYARADVEALLRQNRRPRARSDVAEAAIRWGDPVLTTSISEVREGMLWLRGRSVEDCAKTLTFEQTAVLLCNVDPVDFPAVDPVDTSPEPIARALAYLARGVEGAVPLQQGAAEQIARDGGRLISGVTNALLGHSLAGPLHLRLGRAWGLDARGCDDLRRALVLLSDHDLNPSTFAVRVAASTGASLPASLLCGMATLSGPRHGGAASVAGVALQAVLDGTLEGFLETRPGQSPYGFGFGHPLYPDGDPRARHILDRLPPDAPARIAQRKLSERLGLAPNIDAALAALSMAHGLPEAAAFTIFATGRLAGWVAHAIEQAQSGEIIRPRARYQPT